MINLIKYPYLLPSLICAILSLKVFRLRWPIAYRLFSVYIIVCFLTEIVAIGYINYQERIGVPEKDISNYWILTPMVVVQYVLSGLTYYLAIKSKKIKGLILAIIVLFFCFAIINIAFLQTLTKINTYTQLFADSMMLFCVFGYFEEVRSATDNKRLLTQPLFWISIAFFFYHLLSIPYSSGLNHLIRDYQSVAIAYMYVYRVIIFISYIFIIKAFLCPTPQPQK